MTCNWDSNQAYPHMEQSFCRRFALDLITTLEVVPVALEGSSDLAASETRLSSLNLWSAIMCGFLGTLFLGQLQPGNN